MGEMTIGGRFSVPTTKPDLIQIFNYQASVSVQFGLRTNLSIGIVTCGSYLVVVETILRKLYYNS